MFSASAWEQAAELGSIASLYHLGIACYNEALDDAKSVQFWTKAALQGHVESRYKLGWIEGGKGNFDRAVRHCMISAKMGHKDSLDVIKIAFRNGLATEEQYAEALKGYQAAAEEMKSHDRDDAERLSECLGRRRMS